MKNSGAVQRVFGGIPKRACSLVLMSLLLSACAATPNNPGSSDKPLHAWVDTDLAPYIAEELANNPRFSGASVQLVKFEDQDVAPVIDELVDDIRASLFSALVRRQGVDLAWRPTVQPWQHHRSLAEMDCRVSRRATHYVGIDFRNSATGRQRVDLRALDIESNQWVSGFGLSWSGSLTAGEVLASQSRNPDRFLRGLRPLPFTGDQADLATSYLSHNLSCLLREGAPERLTVYIQDPGADAPRFFHTLTALVGRYMNQFREVEVVGSAAAAQAVVDAEMVPITDGLWQVWMGVTYTDSERRVAGADTPAYVRLDRNEVRRLPASDSGITSTAAAPDVQTAPVATSVSASGTSASLIQLDAFHAMVPAQNSLCNSADPWNAGERRLEGETLNRSACFALAGRAKADSLYLIAKSGEGDWFRMIPSSCQRPHFQIPLDRRSGGDIRFPESGALELTGKGTQELFYLVGAASAQARASVESALMRLPDQCGGGPGTRQSPMGALAEAATAHSGEIAWRQVAINHEP